MVVKAAGTEAAIDRFRALADPQRYQATAQQHKDELIAQGERILLQHELTSSDPNLAAAEKKMALRQLEQAMDSVLWRVGEIDQILASFMQGQEAGMNRQMRRKLAKGKEQREHRVGERYYTSDVNPVVPQTIEEKEYDGAVD